jgi:hypothetical protein
MKGLPAHWQPFLLIKIMMLYEKRLFVHLNIYLILLFIKVLSTNYVCISLFVQFINCIRVLFGLFLPIILN